MNATPQAIQVALRYDGNVFVPDRPFPHLPPGTVIHVWTSTEPTDWPAGYLESTVGQGEDMDDPDDPQLNDAEPKA